jgi:ABC-type Fe3+-siderophore transport system permease subunit
LTVILLTIVTLGIYGLYWQYVSFKELKDYSGEGIGGGLGLVLAIFIGIVNIFLLPMEVGNMYKRDGQTEPVSALTGLWILLPLAGWFVWLVKTQGRLNDYWSSHESPPSAPTIV